MGLVLLSHLCRLDFGNILFLGYIGVAFFEICVWTGDFFIIPDGQQLNV